MHNAEWVDEGLAPGSAFGGWRVVAGLAASAGLALCAASALQRERPQEYATGPGESRMVALAAGAQIRLNAGARLRAVAADGSYKVWLDQGEAFFDIAADGARPLVIDAGIGRVTALGTRLTVRREAGKVSVLVAQGEARVRQSGKEVVLGSQGMAVLSKGGILHGQAAPEQLSSRLGWRPGGGGATLTGISR